MKQWLEWLHIFHQKPWKEKAVYQHYKKCLKEWTASYWESLHILAGAKKKRKSWEKKNGNEIFSDERKIRESAVSRPAIGSLLMMSSSMQSGVYIRETWNIRI